MAYKDRVQEKSTTTGTGDFSLTGAVPAFQSFSVFGTDTFDYCIEDLVSGDWEVGEGSYSGGILSRTTVLDSSNSGAAVDFLAGEKTVFATIAAANLESATTTPPSGDTYFNPSDIGADIVLTSNNTRIGIGATGTEQMGRMFGAKSAGKQAFLLRTDEKYSIGGGGLTVASFGISAVADSVSAGVGAGANSYALSYYYSTGSGLTALKIHKRNGNVYTNISNFSATTIAVNDQLLVLCDFDTGKIWFVLNETVLGGGDPNAGTGEAFTLASGSYLPAVSLREASGASSAGEYTMLTAAQAASVMASYSTFTYWTA